MRTITLKNVPPELHRRLKARAARNHRSLNREAIRLLEESVETSPGEDEAWAEVVAFRERAGIEGGLTIDEIEAAIDEGRLCG